MSKRYIYILSLLFIWTSLSAQAVYECDFEDANERAQWVLNECANETKKASLINFWNIGKAGHFAPRGENGLFIGTSETATTSNYSATTSIMNVAYRHIHLEPGIYTLTFDWIANCKGGQEGIYVCLVPDTVKSYSGGTALTAPWFVNGAIPIDITKPTDNIEAFCLHGTSTWAVATMNFVLTQAVDCKLAFCFYSVKGSVNGPAPAVDNIAILTAGQCYAPKNISHTIVNTDVNLQWKGTADSYDIRTYSYETGKWQEMSVENETSYLVKNVAEGIGVFYLRSHCGEYYSEWVKYEKFIFHKGIRCIDYLDLNNKTCSYGSYTSPGSARGVVDYGYADIMSRHTIHYVKDERDPRTMTEGDPKSGLKTKPDGALASVRLGNWNYGSEAEQITYTHKVDDAHNAILKLQYAVVMENPHPDQPEIQPKFTLSIKAGGKKVDCGQANFVAGNDLSEKDGWHFVEGTSSSGIFYKEWTTVAINLRDYMNQTLTITLTTYDCNAGGHYGYAYFVLGCESGELSGLNCGEDNPTTNLTAPEGFNYEWYKKSDPTKKVIDKNQTHTIEPMDTAIYVVRCINKTADECYYELDACGMPRIPKPVLTYDIHAERCENVVTFYNHSYIELQNMFDNTRTRSEEPITDLGWEFGDGVTLQLLQDTIVHTYPREGGKYSVGLTAFISGNNCYETKYFDIDLPDLTTDTTQIVEELCRKDWPFGYGYDGLFFKNDLDSNFTFISRLTGCDSIVHLVLHWHESVPDVTHPELGFPDTVTICEGYSYPFGKNLLTEQGAYRDTFPDWAGCDSIVDLMLYVVPQLKINHGDSVFICRDEVRSARFLEIPYVVDTGFLDSIVLHIDPVMLKYGLDTVYAFDSGQAVSIEIPDSIPPTRFIGSISYYSPACRIPDRDLVYEINIPTSSIKVKDGLMAIMNSEYNGDLIFSGYQWYRDGQLIKGSEQSYISLSEQDKGHTFTVIAIRPSDGLRITSCPIVYGAQTDLGRILPTDYVHVYNALGQHILSTYRNQIPSLPKGIYIITNGTYATKTIY